MDIEDIIFAVRKGSDPPIRPQIERNDDVNINLIHLVRDCWNENPEKRPPMETVKALMKNMSSRGYIFLRIKTDGFLISETSP